MTEKNLGHLYSEKDTCKICMENPSESVKSSQMRSTRGKSLMLGHSVLAKLGIYKCHITEYQKH